jgi:hypothetical protein
MKDDCLRIDHLDVPDSVFQAPARPRDQRVGLQFPSEPNVVRGHGDAVLPNGVTPQIKNDGQTVLTELPTLGKVWFETDEIVLLFEQPEKHQVYYVLGFDRRRNKRIQRFGIAEKANDDLASGWPNALSFTGLTAPNDHREDGEGDNEPP